MAVYVVRRLLQAIPLLVGLSFAGFVLLRLAPGGPMAVYAQNPSMSEADMRRIERILGLDRPIHVQYLKWAAGMARGELGYSYRTGRPVGEIIRERVPATLELMGVAYLIAITLGLTTGIVSAVRRHSLFDYAATTGAMVGLSVPTFWFGLLVIIVFAGGLRWIPSGGIATLGAPFSLWDRFIHLIGPASVLGLWMTATWSRYARSSVLEVVGQDYIRTARAKGLRGRTVLLRHTLRNALIPLITLAGLEFRNLFGGALVTETVFSWPGVGRLYLDSLNYQDYAVILGLLLVTSLTVVAGSLLADIGYAAADPRIRLG
ncbi:MAG: ABC transporter permease [Candidatus Rokuibacteriota bacterium]|nr:MAG: ABC transporter permease [Candidatus Rokubacteria bacterium]